MVHPTDTSSAPYLHTLKQVRALRKELKAKGWTAEQIASHPAIVHTKLRLNGHLPLTTSPHTPLFHPDLQGVKPEDRLTDEAYQARKKQLMVACKPPY
jgi:hypothetical protein